MAGNSACKLMFVRVVKTSRLNPVALLDCLSYIKENDVVGELPIDVGWEHDNIIVFEQFSLFSVGIRLCSVTLN